MNEKATNPFGSQAITTRSASSLISAEQQRAIAQVQASMLIARSMPRDRKQALDLILQDCTDIELAEEAEYEFSRGGSKISGPSIRILETVARRWGNLESGIEEISRQDGYSEFRAYAMDLETGYRDTKVFQVKHWRDTKSGGHAVTDERDIYETGANAGARRKRACMEAVIPSDIIRQAVNQCQVTLQTKVEITPDLIAAMLENFAKFNVTKEMIEARIQRHITALTPGLVVQLRRIFTSLKDGMAQPADFFDVAPAADNVKPITGADALKEAAKRSAKTNASESAAQPPGAASTTATQAGSGAGAADSNAAADIEITVIDAIAGLEKYKDAETLSLYCDDLPEPIKTDDRFTKAFKKRMDEFKGKGK